MADETTWDSWEDFADSAIALSGSGEYPAGIDGPPESLADYDMEKELDKHVDHHLRMSNGCVSDDLGEVGTPLSRYSDPTSTDETFDNARNSTTQFRILPRPVVHEDDVNRTAYTPQVKILRRPGQESGMLPEKEKQKSLPARSLAEREAAYAEARKRIMGQVPAQTSSTSNNKPRSSDQRKPRNTKHESTQSNPARVERLPKGPDISGKGLNSPR